MRCRKNSRETLILSQSSNGRLWIVNQSSNERLGIYLDAVEPESPLDTTDSIVIRFVPGVEKVIVETREKKLCSSTNKTY